MLRRLSHRPPARAPAGRRSDLRARDRSPLLRRGDRGRRRGRAPPRAGARARHAQPRCSSRCGRAAGRPGRDGWSAVQRGSPPAPPTTWPRALRGRRAARRAGDGHHRGSTRSAPTSPGRSSSRCCRPTCRTARAWRWRPATSRRARATRSAATSTTVLDGRRRLGAGVGDVCGKGAEAAAITALARYTVRASCCTSRRPVSVLRELNEAILRGGPGLPVLHRRSTRR